MTSRRAPARLTPLVVAALVVAMGRAPIARANGTFETFGSDPRADALANAVTAIGGGPAAAHQNPALLTKSKSVELGFAYQLSVPQLVLELDHPRPANDPLAPSMPPPYSGALVGITVPVDIVMPDRLFIGVAAFMPTFVLVHGRALDPAQPVFYLYDSYTDHFDLSASLAVKWLDWLSTGVGVRVAASQVGVARLQIDPLRQRLTHQSLDSAQAPTLAPMAGVTIGPLGIDACKVTLAAVYREPTQFTISLPAVLALDGANAEADLDLLTVANYSPRSITAGLGLDVLDHGAIDVDLQYALWSQAPSPFTHATTKIDGRGLEQLGLKGALDLPAAGEDRVTSPGFKNTLSVRAGVEWRFLDDHVAVRGGYQYRPTPVPDQTSGTNIVDANAHVVSTSAGVSFFLPFDLVKRPITIDGAYQVQILEPRVTKKGDVDDPVGNWRAFGAMHVLSLGLRYAF